jgi:hypothetical protein
MSHTDSLFMVPSSQIISASRGSCTAIQWYSRVDWKGWGRWGTGFVNVRDYYQGRKETSRTGLSAAL